MNSRPPVPQTGALTRLRYAPRHGALLPRTGLGVNCCVGRPGAPEQGLTRTGVATKAKSKRRGGPFLKVQVLRLLDRDRDAEDRSALALAGVL